MAGHLLGQTAGNHSEEGLENRGHAVFTHALDDFLLQLGLSFKPFVGEWAVMPFEIVHQKPREESRSAEELFDFFIGITEFAQRIAPDNFHSDHGHGRSDTVKGHKVYFPFPSLPVPKGRGVAERTIIHVELLLQGSAYAQGLRYFRQTLGELELVAAETDAAVAVVFQIPIEPGGSTDGGVGGDADAFLPLAQFEIVFLSVAFFDTEVDLFLVAGHDALDQLSQGPVGGSRLKDQHQE